jgi:hypothetical protein
MIWYRTVLPPLGWPAPSPSNVCWPCRQDSGRPSPYMHRTCTTAASHKAAAPRPGRYGGWVRRPQRVRDSRPPCPGCFTIPGRVDRVARLREVADWPHGDRALARARLAGWTCSIPWSSVHRTGNKAHRGEASGSTVSSGSPLRQNAACTDHALTEATGRTAGNRPDRHPVPGGGEGEGVRRCCGHHLGLRGGVGR